MFYNACLNKDLGCTNLALCYLKCVHILHTFEVKVLTYT